MTFKESYLVTLERPFDVSINEMKTYIREAVLGWRGGFEPGNPLFEMKQKCSIIRIDREKVDDHIRHRIFRRQRSRRKGGC